MEESEEQLFQRVRVLVRNAGLDPDDFDYLFVPDLKIEDADKYYEIWDRRFPNGIEG